MRDRKKNWEKKEEEKDGTRKQREKSVTSLRLKANHREEGWEKIGKEK